MPGIFDGGVEDGGLWGLGAGSASDSSIIDSHAPGKRYPQRLSRTVGPSLRSTSAWAVPGDTMLSGLGASFTQHVRSEPLATLQQALTRLGNALTIDGLWGPNTAAAVTNAAQRLNYSGTPYMTVGAGTDVPDDLIALIQSAPAPGGTSWLNSTQRNWATVASVSMAGLVTIGLVYWYARKTTTANRRRARRNRRRR